MPDLLFEQNNNQQTPMSETVDTSEHPNLCSQISQTRQEPCFNYQMADMKARKMAALIRISNLPYNLEEVTDPDAQRYVLRTTQGDLNSEYEIIGYIINDSFTRSWRLNDQSDISDDRPCQWMDVFSWTKMNEKIVELRKTLFPLLDEFYRYVQGHQIVKKVKYETLQNKIRKQIHKLDKQIGEHNQIYGIDYSYINIIIACQLFFCYILVFEEKFRKSKAKLFTLCQKIYNTAQFQDIYGKRKPCMKEYQPYQFQEEDQLENKKEDVIQSEIAKIAEPWIATSVNQMRNQLLYNFFRNIFKGQEPKSNYFPYYWMMYDHLLCNIVEISSENGEKSESCSELEKVVEAGALDLTKIIKNNVDYGFLGLYLNEKERKYRIQGLVCLAQITFDELSIQMAKQTSLKGLKLSKLDVNNQDQKKKIEILWQHQTEGTSFEGMQLSLIHEI